MVERDVIARYLSVQTQAEALPLSSIVITPANYKFRYTGSTQVSRSTSVRISKHA